jgi:glutathione S-transferase
LASLQDKSKCLSNFLESIKEYVKNQSLYRDHFLAGKPFLIGDKFSIADLVASVSLEQVRAVDKNLVDTDDKMSEYLERCKALLPEFDEIHKEIRQMPEQLKKMGLI